MTEDKDLKDLLDQYVTKINNKDFIDKDPVQFAHRYIRLQDIEIAGLLTSTISWGKRSMILNNADRMLSMMGSSPYEYIKEGDFPHNDSSTIHRTFNMADFTYLCEGLHLLYKRYTSMQQVFCGVDIFDGIQNLRNIIIEAHPDERENRALKHISSPSAGSACKRLNMFLRWMVRNDGIVDLGCWDMISPSRLYIPLDVHVGNVSRHFLMLDRKQNDRKSVILLTDVLRRFCPEDPIKYDFALFGMGEAHLIDKDQLL